MLVGEADGLTEGVLDGLLVGSGVSSNLVGLFDPVGLGEGATEAPEGLLVGAGVKLIPSMIIES
jgi:hypothetical protein